MTRGLSGWQLTFISGFLNLVSDPSAGAGACIYPSADSSCLPPVDITGRVGASGFGSEGLPEDAAGLPGPVHPGVGAAVPLASSAGREWAGAGLRQHHPLLRWRRYARVTTLELVEEIQRLWLAGMGDQHPKTGIDDEGAQGETGV